MVEGIPLIGVAFRLKTSQAVSRMVAIMESKSLEDSNASQTEEETIEDLASFEQAKNFKTRLHCFKFGYQLVNKLNEQLESAKKGSSLFLNTLSELLVLTNLEGKQELLSYDSNHKIIKVPNQDSSLAKEIDQFITDRLGNRLSQYNCLTECEGQ